MPHRAPRSALGTSLIATFACAGLLAAGPLRAQTTADDSDTSSSVGGWQFVFENDRFVLPARGDGGYTGGWRFDSGFARDATPGWLEPLRAAGATLLGGPATLNLSAGQLAYTPRDAKIAAPQPDQRPWAGMLYAAASVHRLSDGFFRSVELKLGVIGPGSLARQAQTGIHRLTGSDRPAGWGNQLRPRPAIEIDAVGSLRLATFGPLGIDGDAGVVAGTVRNAANVGLGVVIGARPPALPAVSSVVHDHVIFDAAAMRALGDDGWHGLTAFAHAGGQVVASDQFVTGSTFGPQPDVELRRHVAALSAGLNWAVSRDWRLSYVQTRRTSDYRSRNPAVSEGSERWGGVQLSYTCAANCGW